MRIAGEIITVIGVVFVLFGVIGLVRFENFFKRILTAAKIDTIGLMTILIGVAVQNGLSFFSFKVLLLMGILMIINPLSSHMITRAAYLSGYLVDISPKKESNKDFL